MFNVTMLDQTQYSLINPFSNDNFFQDSLVSTSGFNVKLKRSFKWHMLFSFFNLDAQNQEGNDSCLKHILYQLSL